MKSVLKQRAVCQPEGVSKASSDDALLAQFAWAFAHPYRVRLFKLLLAKTNCVCGELVELMPISQSTVSQHLKILKESGVIQGEIDGPKVCYCVNKANLARFKELVSTL